MLCYNCLCTGHRGPLASLHKQPGDCFFNGHCKSLLTVLFDIYTLYSWNKVCFNCAKKNSPSAKNTCKENTYVSNLSNVYTRKKGRYALGRKKSTHEMCRCSLWMWMSQKGKEYLWILINTFSSALLYLLLRGTKGTSLIYQGSLLWYLLQHQYLHVLNGEAWGNKGTSGITLCWRQNSSICHPHEWPLQPVSPYKYVLFGGWSLWSCSRCSRKEWSEKFLLVRLGNPALFERREKSYKPWIISLKRK